MCRTIRALSSKVASEAPLLTPPPFAPLGPFDSSGQESRNARARGGDGGGGQRASAFALGESASHFDRSSSRASVRRRLLLHCSALDPSSAHASTTSRHSISYGAEAKGSSLSGAPGGGRGRRYPRGVVMCKGAMACRA